MIVQTDLSIDVGTKEVQIHGLQFKYIGETDKEGKACGFGIASLLKNP